MSLVEFSLVFVLGLAASLHCVQMCGPIVISYSVFLKARYACWRTFLIMPDG